MVNHFTLYHQELIFKLNSLESTRPTPMMWHRRQTLNDLKRQKPYFLQLMQDSKRCMVEHRMSQSMDRKSVKNAIKCEVIHPQTLIAFTNFTFHTHPHNIPYPSEKDIETTNKLKKEWLAIGIVPLGKVVVFHQKDGFKREVARF